MEPSFETTHPVEREKLRHAARTLTKLLNIEQTNDALNSAAEFLEYNLMDSRASNPNELCDLITVQARIIDAAFHNTLTRNSGTSGEAQSMMDALKFQQQTVRTALAWKKLRTEAYVVRRFITIEKNPHGTD